jgi:mannose-6-phosphate isomerase-like protein (cupin superfamily)
MPAKVETNPDTGQAIDLLGFKIQFLTPPDDERLDFCAMQGTIPAGSYIPLHSHDETEYFIVETGQLEVLRLNDDGPEWIPAGPGDYVHIPNGVPHAVHNPGEVDSTQRVGGTNRLARFLRDAGRPLAEAGSPATRADVGRLLRLTETYGYWLGSPAENAELGIKLEVGE